MTIKIMAVGDIMLGDQDLCLGFGVKSRLHLVDETQVNPIKVLFSQADVIIGNLEAPISVNSDRNEFGSRCFLVEPSSVSYLKMLGFNVLSVANNHIDEHGLTAFNDTIDILQSTGIQPIGQNNTITYMNIEGKRIGFIAFSMIENGCEDITYNKIKQIEEIGSLIVESKKTASYVIISVHWGEEYILYPTPKQVELARSMVDLGADIIIGGHPHVLQGYEFYKNKLIIYSLGNFIFDQTFMKESSRSIIADIIISDDDIKISFHPLKISKKTYMPEFNYMDKTINEHQNFISKLLGSMSLHEYSAWFFNNYRQIYKKKHIAKMEMKIHFLKNIPNYSIYFTYSQFKKIISRLLR